MNDNRYHIYYLTFLATILILVACENHYYPKPMGYFRIDMPEKTYRTLDTTFPYQFEYPVYTKISPDKFSPHESYWINIDYPAFKGSLHLSYKSVDDNLITYIEDSRTLVLKHIPKASAINEQVIINTERDIYGIAYHIMGSGAASPYQFYITDSTNHFIRGALYFNVLPNNDSLSPVIDFIKEDIGHLLNTFQWKEL